jgi:hypothetical protein
MGFLTTVTAGQLFSENAFGEAFTYSNTSLIGVFNEVDDLYTFAEASTRKTTSLICVSSKGQWTTANVAPANRGVLTYGGVTYQIEEIGGANTGGEPAFTLTLKKLT